MNSEQTANILAFYSYYHPKETVDDIAREFKLPAALIVNALYHGERTGLFTTKKDGPQFKEIMVPVVPDDNSDFGKDFERVKSIMLETITNLNSEEEDITDDNLYIWLGVPLIVSRSALQLLLNEGKVARYWIIDSKDPKSKYYFYPLAENKGKMFGKKQFKRQKGNTKNESVPRRKRQR